MPRAAAMREGTAGAGDPRTGGQAGDATIPGFPVVQPLVLDLGCGNGVFLAGLAAVRPGWNVLGIEKKAYRVRQARRRAGDLPNARVLQGEVIDVLHGLPDASVAVVYLLFSDPWPKRRHAVRRLVQEEFADLLAEKLQSDGAFFFASDSMEYDVWARGIFAGRGWRVDAWTVPAGWPQTEFEQRFAAAGFNIWRFQATR
jgi:tRNA (guanine-N7-)-methyltransferase